MRASFPSKREATTAGIPRLQSEAIYRTTYERFAATRQAGPARKRSTVMADGPYLLGIDFGTGGARVGIFDPEGTPLVFSERQYTLEHPRPEIGRASCRERV